jgi:hypothetical protein
LKADYLRQLTVDSPGLAVEVSLVKVTKERDRPLRFEQSVVKEEMLTFREGDQFVFRLSNRGFQPAFCHLVDITPSHQATMLDLQARANPTDPVQKQSPLLGIYLAPGSEAILFADNPLTFAKGKYGREFVKLIAVPAAPGFGLQPWGVVNAVTRWWQLLDQGQVQPMDMPMQVSGVEVMVVKW